MVVSLNRGPEYTIILIMGTPQKGAPNFGKPPSVPDERDPQVFGFGEREGRSLAEVSSYRPHVKCSGGCGLKQSVIRSVWYYLGRGDATRASTEEKATIIV